MEDGSTIDANNRSPGPPEGTRQLIVWAAVALSIALLFNAAWIGLLLWLVIWSTRFLVAQL
jgi:hypothetical protein